MGTTKKATDKKKATKLHPQPVINNDLKKYHTHPVVQKKLEDAKRVLDNFKFQ